MEGSATRAIVPREWDDQNATTQKVIQTCHVFHKIVATEKQLLIPVQLPSKWFHFSPWVGDFQPPCRSHAHIFERDTLHRTIRFSESSYSQPGGGGGTGVGEGEVKWTLKKDRTGDKNKIRSTA